MTLPRFFSRIADAAVPLLAGVDADLLASRLDDTTVRLALAPGVNTAHCAAAYDLAANLLARLYPRLIFDAPPQLSEAARERAAAINPGCEFPRDARPSVSLTLGGADEPAATSIGVEAAGWAISLDGGGGQDAPTGAPAPVAQLAAACIGVGEVFRAVFSAELGDRGRSGASPATLDLLDSAEQDSDQPPNGFATDVGHVCLVGAGAIGQAALLALRVAGAHGEIMIVDPERVELSNLQRYVLTDDASVDEPKVDLAARFLDGSSLAVVTHEQRSTAPLLATAGALRTLVALDSAQDRIAVQAALPGKIYNAWTQPRDLGVSRHEAFGTEPCLACLYWPTSAKPNRHELVASALGEHPLRVLAYLMSGLPVGAPLVAGSIPAVLPLPVPSEAGEWHQRALLDDVAERLALDIARLERWRDAPLDILYREAVCGEAMLDFSLTSAPQEALVPLAHQSALAGVLLAAELICAADPKLRARRPATIERRIDVLASWPQVTGRPRARTSACLCHDDDFRAAAAHYQ